MDKALIGLIGVVVGVFLTLIKDWWFEYRNRRKNIEFLCIHIVCMLDRYVGGCVDVVNDDGLYLGQHGADGCKHTQATLPKFEPQSIDVEWKSLPANIMYEILNFPNEIEDANFRIEAEYEYAAGPPDFDEFFEEAFV